MVRSRPPTRESSVRPGPVFVIALLVVSLVVAGAGAGAGTGVAAAASPDAGLSAAPADRVRATCPAFAAGSVADGENASLNTTTLTAPATTYDRLRNASAIRRAGERGLLSPASVGNLSHEERVVALGDVAVHRIALNGSAITLLDRLAAQDRGSPTANFRALVTQEGIEFRYAGPTACPPPLALNASSEAGAFRVVPDRERGILYVLLDTDDALYYPPGGADSGEPSADRGRWGHHMIGLTLRTSSGLVERNVSTASHYEVEERRVAFRSKHRGLLARAAEPNQPIAGRTTVAPGTTLTIRLEPITAGAPPVNTTATVNRSRAFATTVDLSDAPEGAIYAVSIPGVEPRSTAEPIAPIVAVGNATGAIARVSDQRTTGEVLYDVAVATTDGGFVVARNASGGVVARSDYLKPGIAYPQLVPRPQLRENQTVTVVAYHDANGNRAFDAADEPYRVDGTVVRDAANVTIREDPDPPEQTTTTTTTPSTTTTSTTTTTTTATGTTAGSGGDSGTDGGEAGTQIRVPGFDLAGAVLAIGLLVLLARRDW